MPEGFIENWDRLITQDPGRQIEVGGGHPLWLMYGSDQEQRPLFFVISDMKPGLVQMSDAVEVQRRKRSVDGRWTLSLTLREARLTSQFLQLGNHLVDSTADANNEAHGLKLLVDAISHWKGLFASRSTLQLTRSEIRGFLGELWFGFNRLVESFPARTVVISWGGPFGKPQDFNLPTGQAFEVKTVHPDAGRVQISSAEQLDVAQQTLELAVISMSDVDESTEDAVNLPMMVDRAFNSLESTDHEELRSRLREMGVDIADTYYVDFWFRVDSCTTYRVDFDFPAIRKSSLSPVIDNVKYELELPGIADFIVSRWALEPVQGEDPASPTVTKLLGGS